MNPLQRESTSQPADYSLNATAGAPALSPVVIEELRRSLSEPESRESVIAFLSSNPDALRQVGSTAVIRAIGAERRIQCTVELIDSLAHFPGEADKVSPFLIYLLRDSRPVVGVHAARVLGGFGSQALCAVAPIMSLAQGDRIAGDARVESYFAAMSEDRTKQLQLASSGQEWLRTTSDSRRQRYIRSLLECNGFGLKDLDLHRVIASFLETEGEEKVTALNVLSSEVSALAEDQRQIVEGALAYVLRDFHRIPPMYQDRLFELMYLMEVSSELVQPLQEFPFETSSDSMFLCAQVSLYLSRQNPPDELVQLFKNGIRSYQTGEAHASIKIIGEMLRFIRQPLAEEFLTELIEGLSFHAGRTELETKAREDQEDSLIRAISATPGFSRHILDQTVKEITGKGHSTYVQARLCELLSHLEFQTEEQESLIKARMFLSYMQKDSASGEICEAAGLALVALERFGVLQSDQ